MNSNWSKGVMISSRTKVLCGLLAVVSSACVSVERIPDHYCTGWDEGLDAANQIRASVGLDSIALECDRDGGRLAEVDVLLQKVELGLPVVGSHAESELYCWGSVNGYTAPFDDMQDTQDMLGITGQDLQTAIVNLYRECVKAAESQAGT